MSAVMPSRRTRSLATVAALVAGMTVGPLSAIHAEDREGLHGHAVKVVVDQTLNVTTGAGTGTLGLYLSADWTQPLPNITRAVLVFHGKLRNADRYYRSGLAARAAAGEAGQNTLVIAPQFLTPADLAAHKLPDQMLRWRGTAWMGGEPAAGPAGLSSFDAIDAVLARLADRSVFPKLTQVVLAGHSAGGQVVQRYAVVGQGEAALRQSNVRVRYVIANPSSYVYFSEDRPRSDGTVGPFQSAKCPAFNRWKYGLEVRPPYAAERSPEELERDYVRRDVRYLLGAKDTDPDHPALDKSCEAEAQGSYRLVRGHAYFDYLKNRARGEFNQRIHDIPGVGHQGRKMLTSACALAVLFGTADCAAD
jgi:pimeloyl-ACP methyl ester carboxylesterase